MGASGVNAVSSVVAASCGQDTICSAAITWPGAFAITACAFAGAWVLVTLIKNV